MGAARQTRGGIGIDGWRGTQCTRQDGVEVWSFSSAGYGSVYEKNDSLRDSRSAALPGRGLHEDLPDLGASGGAVRWRRDGPSSSLYTLQPRPVLIGELLNSGLARIHLALTGDPLREGSERDGEASFLALLIAVLAFGFELTNPTLGIDDEIFLGTSFSFSGPRPKFLISRGMWGLLLVQYLVPGGWITPFISLVVGIVLQLLAAVVLGWILRLKRAGMRERVLLYSVFVTFPYFADQMAMSYL